MSTKTTTSPSSSKPTVTPIQKIETRLTPFRDELLNHRVYGEIDRLDAMRIFMEHHVFAVWDFMSLLKTLQQQICCTEVPWLPPANAQAARFINEIVLAEESDGDSQIGYASHFDLYHRSMTGCGASTIGIDSFLAELRRGVPVQTALAACAIPAASRQFVQHTFSVIESGNLCAIASAFTFGREDLLPDVFQCIVDQLNGEAGGQLEDFKYYLARHIDLDGDQHGPMAARLVESLCRSDESNWQIAEEAAVNCLIARRKLWDGIDEAIRAKVEDAPSHLGTAEK